MKSYNATEFIFKKGFIYCDGMVMPCKSSCNIPVELLESIDATFRIKRMPGNKFMFVGKDLDKLFDELYRAYYPFIIDQLCRINYAEIASGIVEEGLPKFKQRVSIRKEDIKRIIEGNYDNWYNFYSLYDFQTTGSECYSTLEQIENEFGETIPEKFYTEYMEDEYLDFGVDLNGTLSLELNKGIVRRLQNLSIYEKLILLSAKIHEDGYADITICPRDGIRVLGDNIGFPIDIPMESLKMSFQLYVEVSGNGIRTANSYAWNHDDINKIYNCIMNVQNEEIKACYLDTWYYISANSQPFQQKPKHDLIELDFTKIRKITENKFLNYLASKYECIYMIIDMNYHKSDGNWLWYSSSSSSFKSYLCVKDDDCYKGMKHIAMVSNANGKADYHFRTETENLPVALFALWAYWGSTIDNKRKDFDNQYFKPFGIIYLYKI